MKILIIDDHLIFLQGATAILNQILDDPVIYTAANHEIAQAHLADHPDIDLIFMDLNMPDADGLTQLGQIRRRYPLVPVAVLSASDNIMIIRRCLEMGAMGFIPKSHDATTLLNAIHSILDGELYVPEDIKRAIKKASESAENDIPRLTSRQIQVLKQINAGHSNKTIADNLNIAENTVKVHIMAIYKTFNVDCRISCLKKAQEYEFV